MAAPNNHSAPQVDLSQLKDIHLPHVISDWPIALGWWALLILLALILCAGVYFWRHFKAKNANKKAALSLLGVKYSQFKSTQDSQAFLQQTNQILKRYCLKQYPAAVGLSGLAWTSFLIRHSEKTFINDDLANAMSQGLYQIHCQYDVENLYTTCASWIKNNKNVELDITVGISND